MKKLRLLWACAMLCAAPAMAHAQRVVAACGTQSLVLTDPANTGTNHYMYMDAAGNLCVSGTSSGGVAGVTMTNKSGTIAVGGDATQIAIAANPNRVSCHVQPQASDMYINPATTAPLSRASEFIPVLSEFTCPAGYKGAIAISGLTTGSDFYADEGTVP